MVEDNADYALDCAKNGVRTFLLAKPWNQKYEAFTFERNFWFCLQSFADGGKFVGKRILGLHSCNIK